MTDPVKAEALKREYAELGGRKLGVSEADYVRLAWPIAGDLEGLTTL